MNSNEQEWHARQEQYLQDCGRGFEDGLAGAPPEQDEHGYREGFDEGRLEGFRANKIINE